MHPIICFTSDFGPGDTWVGICHAVIYRACPQTKIADLAHDVPPFDIRKAAVVAASGAWQLPDAIHLVVVDPGVGGGRKDLVLVTTGGSLLVGPDNGVLLPAAWRSGGIERAYSIDTDHFSFRTPLATFHARDVLAPAAALLSCGVEVESFAEPTDAATLVPAPFEPAHREGDSAVTEVIDVDRFGSIRIAVTAENVEGWGFAGRRLEFVLGHVRIAAPFGSTFSDVPESDPVALVDSSGWLTLAVNLGSAAERYGIEAGASVRVSAI